MTIILLICNIETNTLFQSRLPVEMLSILCAIFLLLATVSPKTDTDLRHDDGPSNWDVLSATFIAYCVIIFASRSDQLLGWIGRSMIAPTVYKYHPNLRSPASKDEQHLMSIENNTDSQLVQLEIMRNKIDDIAKKVEIFSETTTALLNSHNETTTVLLKAIIEVLREIEVGNRLARTLEEESVRLMVYVIFLMVVVGHRHH